MSVMQTYAKLFIFAAIIQWFLAPIALAQDTQPTSYTSAVRYDDRGRVTGTIAPDPDGSGSLKYAASRTTYNAIGLELEVETGELATWQPTSVRPKDWTGFTVFLRQEHVYDPLNRKIKSTTFGSDGSVQAITQTAYDAIDRPVCSVVRMSLPIAATSNPCLARPPVDGVYDRVTKNIYDQAGQVLQVRQAVGTNIEQAQITYSYTGNGKQQFVVDANGNKAQLVYDGHDRQIRWSFPSKTRPTSYDDSTPLSALTSAGLVSTSDYEAYTYDPNGNRNTLRKRGTGIITYNYDKLNRVITKTDTDPLTRNVHYGYDNRDLQTYARYDSATGTDGIDIVYDGFGRILETNNKMFAAAKKLTYEYDKNGNRTKIIHPDGEYFTYSYDKVDRVKAIKQNGSSVLITNSYNNIGQMESIARTYQTTSYGYDAALRPDSLTHDLRNSDGDVVFGFDYNAASQIISRSIDNAAYVNTAHYNIERDYATNGLNQYSGAGPVLFDYDDNGNLTKSGETLATPDVTYAYDIENRLVTARGNKEANLIYDPMGRLFETNANANLAQTTTQFLYDGDALVAEYDNAGNMLHRYVHGGGVDNPVVWYIGDAVNTASRTHMHANWQGSITAVADYLGNVEWINGYDEYGIPNWDNAGRFQYTGQINLPELEMYYYKARIYSPTMGRFLQTDPIGYEDQFNLYAYAGNNPVNLSDPSGTCAMVPCPLEMPEGTAVDRLRGFAEEAGREAWRILGSIPGTNVQVRDTPASSKAEAAGRINGKAAVWSGSLFMGATSNGARGTSLVTNGARNKAATTTPFLSLTQRAASMVSRNGNQHRVSIPTSSGRLNIDLAGRPHFNKATNSYIPTPHVEVWKSSIIPAGPRAGQQVNMKVGTRAATASDLRLVDRYLIGRGR